LHDQRTNLLCRDFALATGQQPLFDAVYHLINLLSADGSLAQRQIQAIFELFRVVIGATAIALDHRWHGQLSTLVGGEAPVTLLTPAATAHEVPFLTRS
jgi:hypothetical protein